MTWRAEITLGPYTWTIDEDDTADPDNPGPLAGLRIGWTMPDGDLYPTQPDPVSCSMALIVPDIADVEELDIGSAAAVDVSDATGGPVVFEFRGRLTDLKAVAHARGVHLSLIALDHTLDERRTGFTAAGDDVASNHIGALFAAVGLDEPTLPYPGGTVGMRMEAGEPRSLPEALAPILLSMVGGSTWPDVEGNARTILAPLVDGLAPVDPDPFVLDELPERSPEPVTGVFGPTAGGYGIDLAADAAAGVLDAAFVDAAAVWIRNKWLAVNQVDVTYRDVGDVEATIRAATGETPIVSARIDTPIVPGFGIDIEAAAQRVADYYLPEHVGNKWTVERFTWQLSRHIDDGGIDLSDVGPGWMPVHTAAEDDPIRTLAYRRVVAVVGIPEHQNPAAGGIYAGRLVGAELTVNGRGELTLAFSLRRHLPKSTSTVDVLTPAGLAASAYNGVTVADLDPDFTVYDYRLAQEAA